MTQNILGFSYISPESRQREPNQTSERKYFLFIEEKMIQCYICDVCVAKVCESLLSVSGVTSFAAVAEG